jgi:hypothetical protein
MHSCAPHTLLTPQEFFRCGFQGSPAGGAPLFDVSTQHALLERYMGRQDAAGLGLHAAGLFLDIFHQVRFSLSHLRIEQARCKVLNMFMISQMS